MPDIFLDISGFDFILSNITTLIMILTLISLLLANLSRMMQAKKYGIPLKIVNQASIPDSLEVWIKLICVLGLGLAVPVALLNVDAHIIVVFSIAFVSGLIGIATSTIDAHKPIKNDRGIVVDEVSFNKYVYPGLALIMAAAFSYFHYFINITGVYIGTDIVIYQEASRSVMQIILMILSAVWLTLHVLIVLLSLIVNTMRNMFGYHDILTVEIDDQLYLIAMRHIANFWIFIPCTLDIQAAKGNISIGESEPTMVNVVKFIKGRFIIRDISSLDGAKTILCKKQHDLVGLKDDENLHI